MKIIVGLGNPGKEYENTFHNLGFTAADKVADKLGVRFDKNKFRALVAEAKVRGEKVVVLKPQTYMNLSGESVAEAVNFFKADLKDVIVCYDDFDLKAGSLRIRESGSAGTHNGMRSVIASLGSEKFARVRVGFNRGDKNVPLINLVLSGIRGEEKDVLDKSTSLAAEALFGFASGESVQALMQKYNTTG